MSLQLTLRKIKLTATKNGYTLEEKVWVSASTARTALAMGARLAPGRKVKYGVSRLTITDLSSGRTKEL